MYRQCFSGSEAVACMVGGVGGEEGRTEVEAVSIGSAMIRMNLISRVGATSSSSSPAATVFKKEESAWYNFVSEKEEGGSERQDSIVPMREVFDKQQQKVSF